MRAQPPNTPLLLTLLLNVTPVRLFLAGTEIQKRSRMRFGHGEGGAFAPPASQSCAGSRGEDPGWATS